MDALSELLSRPESEKVERGFVHTAAEIVQQPDTWLSTFQVFQRRREEVGEFLSAAGLNLGPVAKAAKSTGHPSIDSTSSPTVFLIGAGTSDYVGQSLTHLLCRAWQCEVVAVPSTDLLTHRDALLVPGKKYLWVSFSRSGDSPEGVAALAGALANRRDIHHLVVTCNAKGRMLREISGKAGTLGICLDEAVNDRGLAMTSSFTNMVVFGQCLAHIENPDGYEQVLTSLVEAGRSLLPAAANCAAALAGESYRKACFVGSGPLRAVARECALKLLELTAGRVLTMSESALGLRHGPMAALDQETLFVCLMSGDRRVQQYEHDLLKEIGKKQLAKKRIVVSGGGLPADNSLAEQILAISQSGPIKDEYRPVLDVIFGQLLGLFSSIQCGLKPDCPSPTGAISRVVQNVSIHS